MPEILVREIPVVAIGASRRHSRLPFWEYQRKMREELMWLSSQASSVLDIILNPQTSCGQPIGLLVSRSAKTNLLVTFRLPDLFEKVYFMVSMAWLSDASLWLLWQWRHSSVVNWLLVNNWVGCFENPWRQTMIFWDTLSTCSVISNWAMTKKWLLYYALLASGG
jgi:hypothetical protein